MFTKIATLALVLLVVAPASATQIVKKTKKVVPEVVPEVVSEVTCASCEADLVTCAESAEGYSWESCWDVYVLCDDACVDE